MMHPADPFHIILDALAILKARIEEDPTFRPWEDYAGDDDDPKLTKGGYQSVLEAAEEIITRTLNSI